MANFVERAVILTRGRTIEAPLAELRRGCHNETTQTVTTQEEIARIVKETINALDGRKSVADEHVKKQREEIVRALTESKGRAGDEDGAAAPLGLNRTALLSRMKKLGMHPKQFSSLHTGISSDSHHLSAFVLLLIGTQII